MFYLTRTPCNITVQAWVQKAHCLFMLQFCKSVILLDWFQIISHVGGLGFSQPSCSDRTWTTWLYIQEYKYTSIYPYYVQVYLPVYKLSYFYLDSPEKWSFEIGWLSLPTHANASSLVNSSAYLIKGPCPSKLGSFIKKVPLTSSFC